MTVNEQFETDPHLQIIRDGMRGAAETSEEAVFVDWFLGLPVSTGEYELNFKLRQLMYDHDVSTKNSALSGYGAAVIAELHRQFGAFATSAAMSVVLQTRGPRVKELDTPPRYALAFTWPFTIASQEVSHG